MELAKECQNKGMFKEQAYLLIKNGNIEAGVNVMVENCGDDLASVIDLAVAFNISDEILWNEILKKSAGSVSKINQLLRYADVYGRPERFIDQYDDDLSLGQIYDPLMDMFSRLKTYKLTLKSAE